jgi:uncharacterized protein YsxB (DUF464 family)
MIDKYKILDKTECLTLLCTRAYSHWSLIKFVLNLPLVFTSSAMCIINSISTDANKMKIPNIVVNACSVLLMSLLNSIKPAEKFENFKKLSQQFLMLSHDLEMLEDHDEDYKNKLNILSLKYDQLIQDVNFEDIPDKYKNYVSKLFSDNNRHIPIQLNGTIGMVLKKRNSNELSLHNLNV